MPTQMKRLFFEYTVRQKRPKSDFQGELIYYLLSLKQYLLFQEAQKKKLEDLERAKQLHQQGHYDELKKIEKEAQEKLKKEEEERIERVQYIYQDSKTLATVKQAKTV